MERSLQRLIVMAGLPGTGKSCIAEAVGRELGSPVFAKDWLEAALRRSDLAQASETTHLLGSAGYELLSTLAERQLRLGQSAILDSVASTASIRTIWRTLATTYGAAWYVVECTCSAVALHRERLLSRERGVPDWPEVDWSDVERVRGSYALWQEERLILDASCPMTTNIARALRYVLGD
jgi:predicted kinase